MPAALITGAARRIGARLALALAEAGYDVALHYRGHADEAAETAGRIEALGRRCVPLQAELTDARQRDSLPFRATEALGPLAVLINNASYFHHDLFESLEESTWDATLAANLTVPVFLARRFVEVAPPGGLIVNLLDFKVFSPNPDHFSYSAGKIALAGLTQPLAMALAPRFRVCGLAPGLTLPSGPQTLDNFEAARAELLSAGATPDDLARSLRFILDTPAFNGQVLTVDGGESLLRRTRDVAYGGV